MASEKRVLGEACNNGAGMLMGFCPRRESGCSPLASLPREFLEDGSTLPRQLSPECHELFRGPGSALRTHGDRGAIRVMDNMQLVTLGLGHELGEPCPPDEVVGEV